MVYIMLKAFLPPSYSDGSESAIGDVTEKECAVLRLRALAEDNGVGALRETSRRGDVGAQGCDDDWRAIVDMEQTD